jgi:ribosomal protein S1
MTDLEKEEFEKLLEESLKTRDDFNPGDKIEGTIVLINNEVLF